MEKIDVYVRLGDGDERRPERTLSFQVPEGISQSELLDTDIEGYKFSIDGTHALMSVTPFDDGRDDFRPLAAELGDVQRKLIVWLAEKGYEVNFT